ncbi:hypothetical protein [Halobaculum limi]|uniref:hypothetical protein n=1 Tax=Halobaculum limi TaxID=3031916 RepID=UPI0024061C1B|nr:hypothetical protein [Halobaculum sp. YSMS11]
MNSWHRDAVLAAGATVALLVATRLLGLTFWSFGTRPALVAAAVGVAGAVALELVMARNPGRARRLWADRRVRWGGTLLVAVGGPLAAAVGGRALAPLVLACLLGGLFAYFLLLTGVLSGVLAPPETWFAREE